MNKDVYKVEIVFTEPILGSQGNRDTMEDYINPDLPEDEIPTLATKLEKGTTTFHHRGDEVLLWDYQVKGFLKHAASVVNGLKQLQVKALKSKVEDHVFVFPRTMTLEMDGSTDFFTRPISGWTPQGPIVALMRSERAPAGSKIHLWIEIMEGSPIDEDILRTLLDYGQYCGIGQWRNGGFGRFTFTIEKAFN